MPYTCPVCGYKGLTEPPRNFSICPSCGTEFGYDDAKLSHAELRWEWILQDAPCFSTARHPQPDWNPWLQLIDAGYDYVVPFRSKICLSQPSTDFGKAEVTQQISVQFT